MKEFFNHHTAVKFIGRTIFYFLIIMALVYLYSYAGINNSGFIYNEF
ncbi:teichoic acid D-Ala incorporation-associated protein DltX [Bombilactobacillus bombi]|nr:teichoic acid D-Ala incorporation-associated protein DltX [Bombilactobacillus bombi]MBA1434513.1 teichoic acid D-Ala incorporation-associated protein DltX [Bombilactobacillus bombi]